MSGCSLRRLGGTVAIASILALSLDHALAQAESNYWQGIAGDFNGNFNDTGHWTLGHAPAPSDEVFFNAVAPTPYSVRFTAPWTNGALHVYEDSVTFDMNGYTWLVPWDRVNGSAIGREGLTNMTVTFSSSHAPRGTGGNVADIGQSYPHLAASIGAVPTSRNVTFIVDDSLGYPATVIWSLGNGTIRGCRILVSGANAEFSVGYCNPGPIYYCDILVTNGAVLSGYNGLLLGHYSSYATCTVVNAYLKTAFCTVAGYLGNATLYLRDGSTWTDNSLVQVGYDGYGAGPYRGNLFIDNSTFVGQNMTVGGCDGNPPGPGQVWIRNGSSATLANTLWVTITNAAGWATSYPTVTNLLVLDNSTLNLGASAVPGTLRNEGIVRAAGGIVGQGTGHCLVRNEAMFEVGAGLCTLAMTNAQLDNAASGTMFLEFTTNACDQIDIVNGTATIGGTCVFATVDFTPKPRSNRTWDFIRADSIVYTATDNLTNLMASFNMVPVGDYAFGVVDIAGGRKALRLRIYPQPSMMLELR